MKGTEKNVQMSEFNFIFLAPDFRCLTLNEMTMWSIHRSIQFTLCIMKRFTPDQCHYRACPEKV